MLADGGLLTEFVGEVYRGQLIVDKTSQKTRRERVATAAAVSSIIVGGQMAALHTWVVCT